MNNASSQGSKFLPANLLAENCPTIQCLELFIDATDTFDQIGNPAVSMQMNGNGSRKWEQITGAVSQQGNAIAIVLDNIVYSAPGVSKGAITGGRSEISGNFSIEETKDLANILRAGKLPAAAEIVQSEVVGPSLGEASIKKGTWSLVIGFFLVLIFMVVYYRGAGLIAVIAVLANMFICLLTFPQIVHVFIAKRSAMKDCFNHSHGDWLVFDELEERVRGIVTPRVRPAANFLLESRL